MTINMSELPVGGTMCHSSAGLAIGSGDAKDLDIAAPNGAGVDYSINGISYHKADAADIAITAHTVQAVSTSCMYLVCLNTSGTLSTVKGTEVLTASITAGTDVLQWPQPVVDTCPIGGVRVDTNGSTTFTGGTTDFSAAGVTDTYYNIMLVPDEPFRS